MTSEERREARYSRRKARRNAKKTRLSKHDNFEWVFSYDHLYQSYKKCRRGVAWKSSTQKYITMAPLNVYTTYEQLRCGKYKTKGFVEFDISERGKERHIRSVTISERVVQRCLCDYALVPMIARTFIYDSGAAMAHKGYHFAIRRLCQHLREHYKKHGRGGYILLFDFSKFFDSVSHAVCKGILAKEFSNERIIRLVCHFIDAFGDVGLGLGSQISQTLALASANRLDHYAKDVCRIRGYGRYMDDGYLIHENKEYLRNCLAGIRHICDELGIQLNPKKTQIIKLSHGFTWLKTHFYLTESGKVIRKICRQSVTKMRRKLKALKIMVGDGKMSGEDVYSSWQSWHAYAKHFNTYHTIHNMKILYHQLFAPSEHC